MRNLISLIDISELGNLISLITYEQNLKEIIQAKAVRKCIGLRKHMKPTYPKMVFKFLPLNTLCTTFESEHSSN